MGWSIFRIGAAILTGGQSEVIRQSAEVAGEVVEIVIDVQNQVVQLGKKVFRAIPGELILPGFAPIAGLLKNEIEDEFLVLCRIGVVFPVSFAEVTDAVVAVGTLLHLLKSRRLRDDELKVARFVFRDSINFLDEVTLTNIRGLDGRAFAIPSMSGGTTINLGGAYRHSDSVETGLLMHELTHAWQISRETLPELFMCKGIKEQAQHSESDQYDYEVGDQWANYKNEQQGNIVKDWVTGHDGHRPFSLGSPLFAYINGNVRTANNSASVLLNESLAQRLAEAGLGASVQALCYGRSEASKFFRE